jgi:peptide/nickel transport system ATP-binding protein
MRNIRGNDIAMIFQEPMSSLSPVHRIGYQIEEVLRLHEKMTKKQARERSIELLSQVGITNPETAVDRYSFEFSGGMRQRAMIAMALACDPAVLIADEPTTALDVTIQAEILELIQSLQAERQMAVLFITHDMGVVAQIADDIVVMRHSKLVENGNVYQVFEDPKHPYTRQLISSAQDLDRPSTHRVAARARRGLGGPVLTAKDVRKEFALTSGGFGKKQQILVGVDDVSLELRAGENLGIVGESGSGKTTLARCLQRIHDPTSGQITYEDRTGKSVDVTDLSAADLRPVWRDIRTVFQDPFGSLNPRMKVGEIIAEPLLVAGGYSKSSLKERVEELLDLVDLPSSSAQRYPHAFSGGQRQRIAIARAIGPNPRIIIADEPTSALDVGLRTKVLDLLLTLQDRLDLSYVFVTHDFAVVRYFCDRVAVMHRGSIVEIGETEAVCSTPQHAYTKSLMSAIPQADPTRRSVNRVLYCGT